MDSMTSENDLRTRAVAAVDAKIDLFFNRHIVPVLEPSRIRWWFSLSGGKDSFSMAQGVRRWYERMGVRCTASCFIIDQWGGSAAQSVRKQLNWPSPLIVVDGRTATQEATNYVAGQQAPCRTCSDARHDLTDALLSRDRVRGAECIDVVARGLHLTDTSVSLLWRHALGRKAAEELLSLGKAKPLVRLPDGHYLAKPLTYVREFESGAYADAHGYKSACCGCPACRFPSRRDIVEESLCRFMEGALWEFGVPGVRTFLNHLAADEDIERMSAGGFLFKHRHLPDAFVTFAVERFRRLAAESRAVWSARCDPSIDLDLIGAARLKGNDRPTPGDRVPTPALLAGRALEEREKWMIATMGPFWGAIGLPPALASKAWTLQETCFGFSNDERWSQVNGLLHEFYSRDALPKSEHVIALSRLTRKRGAASHAI